MPKRTSTAYESDDGFVDHDSDAPAVKRSKTKASASKPRQSSTGTHVDDDGNEFWNLNDKGTRRVTINEFKGKMMVNIREYYEKDGKSLPGKKGISLMLDQYNALIQALPAIETALTSKGQTVSRPAYDGAPEASMDDADDVTSEQELPAKGKKNFESTSEEED